MNPQTDSVAAMWQRYRDAASVEIAEKFAGYTLPALMIDPTQNMDVRETVIHDFQSAGGFLVNNLAAKLSGALFPANRPNFKVEVSDELKQAALDSGISENEVSKRAATLERKASERLFLNAGLSKLQRALKLTIVTGDCLVYRDTQASKMIVWNRHSYAVRRHPNGDIMAIILKQRFTLDSLEPAILADLQDKKPGKYTNPQTQVDMFTLVRVEKRTANNVVHVKNEIDGVRVGPEAQYPEHLSPWVVPVWNLADGEHYGRGLVEDFAGDFARLSLVSKQLGLYELDSLNILNLVDEAGGSSVDDYQAAETGDYVPGKTGSVTAYERGDYNKMAAVRASIQEVLRRLNAAFMYTGDMRDAERVTAAEVYQIAREADTTLGGAYSQLAGTLQAPLAFLTMVEVSPSLLMGLMRKDYRPSIVTGVPALSRSAETQNLLQASQEVATIVPVLAQADTTLDPQKITSLILTNNSVDVDTIKKSQQQLQQEADAKAQAAQAQQAAAQQSLAAASSDLTQSTQQVLEN